MIISNCPSCDESFRVPAGQLPENAYAMCPWCRETFPLSDVLASLPPRLELITEDGEPLVIPEPVALGAIGASSLEMNKDQGQHSVGPGNFDETATAALETIVEDPWIQSNFEVNQGHVGLQVEGPDNAWDDQQAAAPIPVSSRPGGSRKKKASGLRTMIGIVFGGLLSIPIAFGILLLLGREPNLGFWPFDGSIRVRRPPAASPPRPLSDRTPKRNRSQGSMLDTSAFDQAFEAMEDPSLSALSEIIPGDSNELTDASESQANDMKLALGINKADVADIHSIVPSLGISEAKPELSENSSITVDASAAGQIQPIADDKVSKNVKVSDAPLQLPKERVTDETLKPETPSIDSPSSDGDSETPMTDTTTESIVDVTPVDSEPVEDLALSSPLASPTQDLASPTQDPASPTQDPASTEASPTTDVPKISDAQTEPDDASKADPPDSKQTSDDRARIDQAIQSLEKLITYDRGDENRRTQLVATYANIAKACDLTGDEVSDLQPLATKILQSPALSDIEYAGAQWLVFAKRESDGIALIGRPGTSTNGEILTLESGKIVDLIGNSNLPTVEKVMVLGRIVDNSATVKVAHVEALP